jgi:hypothetical protein
VQLLIVWKVNPSELLYCLILKFEIMKKFILFLIAIFCISSFTSTIEAKPNTRYYKYHRTYKKNVRKMQKKSYKHAKRVSSRDFGKFRSNLTGKVYNGVKPLTYTNTHKKK